MDAKFQLWLNSLPKPVLIAGALIIIMILVKIMRPGHTKCDAQKLLFRERMIGVLFPDSKKEYVTLRLKKDHDLCSSTRDAGGCLDYLSTLKLVADEVQALGRVCGRVAADPPEADAAIKQATQLLAEVAWGDKAPEAYLDRVGWMDESQVLLFCRLKKFQVEMHGQDAWEIFKATTLKTLPGAKETESPEESFKLSLFSVPCGN
jgi:hypothetical protein